MNLDIVHEFIKISASKNFHSDYFYCSIWDLAIGKELLCDWTK